MKNKQEKNHRVRKTEYTYNDWVKSGSRIIEVREQEGITIIEVDNFSYQIQKSELDRIRKHQRDNIDKASDAVFQTLKAEFKQKLLGWKDLGFSNREKFSKAQKELKFVRIKLIDPYARREEDQKYAKNLEDYLGHNILEEENMKAYQRTHPLESDEHYWALINDFGQSTFDEITGNWNDPEHGLARYFGWRKYNDYLVNSITKSRERVRKNAALERKGGSVKTEEDIDLSPYLHYLKEVDPPVISDANHFILPGGKGAIVAWIDVLLKNDYIPPVSHDLLASSINECIKDIKMIPGYFRKDPTRKYKDYKSEFTEMMKRK